MKHNDSKRIYMPNAVATSLFVISNELRNVLLVDGIFLKAFFFSLRQWKKANEMQHWNQGTKLNQNHVFCIIFVLIYQFAIFYLILTLTQGQISKSLLKANSPSEIDHKICFARHSCLLHIMTFRDLTLTFICRYLTYMRPIGADQHLPLLY